jgi:hypothetical protein
MKGRDCDVVRGSTAGEQGQAEQEESQAFHAIHLGVISFRRQRISNVANELVDLFFGRRPSAHQSVNVGLNKIVKAPAAPVQIGRQSLGHSHKHRVRLTGKYRFRAEDIAQFLGEKLGIPVRVQGILDPRIVGQ